MVFVGLVTNEELYARTVRMSTLKYTSAKINKDYHILFYQDAKYENIQHNALLSNLMVPCCKYVSMCLIPCTCLQFDGTVPCMRLQFHGTML